MVIGLLCLCHFSYASGLDFDVREKNNQSLNTTDDVTFDTVTVSDEAYNATTWNGALTVPTKNAVRDKIEGLTNPFTTGGGLSYLTTTTDNLSIGGSSNIAKVGITGDADEIQLRVIANATNTSNVALIEKSDGTDLFKVDVDGTTTFGGTGAGAINFGTFTLSDDTDGMLIMTANGNGSDEDLRWNLDDTSNTAVVTSTTGLSKIDFQAISLASTTNMPGNPKHLRFTIMQPLEAQTEDNEICIWNKTDAALTITNLEVSLDASANEVLGDIKYADTFIGLANPVVINDFDTTSGVRSDSSITSGAVAAGKAIYVSFDSAPNTAIKQMNVDLTYDYD